MTPPDAGGSPPRLTYPFETPAGYGIVGEPFPGILWLRLPLPMRLNHINLWLMSDGDGWTLVDTGLGTPEAKEIWEEIFAKGLQGKPITRMIVTHFHPDHVGLAGWLAERWGVTMVATELEWLYGRIIPLESGPVRVANATRFYCENGLSKEVAEVVANRPASMRPFVSTVPTFFKRVSDGDDIEIGGRNWRVIVGQGHSPEHACLFCPEINVMIAGDQVLPRITPNVSVWPAEPEGNPLSRFLSSLARIDEMVRTDPLVLPSHWLPFQGLNPRIGYLIAHHDERLAEVEVACVEPRTGADIVPLLFRRELDISQMGIALGEALAHTHLLMGQGRLRKERRPDGAIVFRKP